MLHQRVLTSVAGIPLVAAALLLGHPVFGFFILLLSLIAGEEMRRLLSRRGFSLQRFMALLPGAAIPVALMFGFESVFRYWPLWLLWLVVWTTGKAVVADRRGRSQLEPVVSLKQWAGYAFLTFYPAWCLALLVVIHGGYGWTAVAWLLAVVWAGDTAAYFGGRWLGRHSLVPTISGGKSEEGAVIGAAVSGVAAVGLAVWLPPSGGTVMAPGWLLFVVGTGLGMLAQAGDLWMSLLKRWSGVKDVGHLLPGHGGVLDRFDGVILATPVFWMILTSGWFTP